MGEEGQGSGGSLEGGQGQESTQHEGAANAAQEGGQEEAVEGGAAEPGEPGEPGTPFEEGPPGTEPEAEPGTPAEPGAEPEPGTEPPAEEQPAQTDEVSDQSPGWAGTRDASAAEPDPLNEQGGPIGIHAEVDHETGKQGPPSDPPPSTATEPIVREDR